MSDPVAYLLGELDDAQVAAFERAMAADPGCARRSSGCDPW